jgi:hypothetical protein
LHFPLSFPYIGGVDAGEDELELRAGEACKIDPIHKIKYSS